MGAVFSFYPSEFAEEAILLELFISKNVTTGDENVSVEADEIDSGVYSLTFTIEDEEFVTSPWPKEDCTIMVKCAVHAAMNKASLQGIEYAAQVISMSEYKTSKEKV